MSRGWTLLVGLLAITALAAPVAAQAGAPGTAFLNTEPPSGAQAPSFAACGETELHGLGPQVPAGEAQKAYTSRSTAQVSCFTYVRGAVEESFVVTDAPSANLFLGCDQPTRFASAFPNIRVSFTRSDEVLASGSASVGPLCQPGDVLQAELEMEWTNDSVAEGGVAFAPDDNVGLNLSVFAEPNAGENVHFLVGGNESASSISAPGLYQSLEPETDNATDLENETNESNLTEQSGDQTDEENGTPGFGAVAAIVAGAGLALVRRRLD